MIRALPAAAALALVACSAPSEAEGQTGAHKPVEPVVDQAEIIPATEEVLLDRRLREYWANEKTAIVVATVRSLDGQSIEDTAFGLFSDWGISDGRTNRGLLILVAPNEHKARIEVGCGLESIITDPVAQDIMDHQMIPRFSEGDYNGAIAAGVDELTETLATATEAGPISPACVEIMKAAA